MEKKQGLNIKTTFNILSNGLNFNQKKKLFKEKEKEEKQLEEKNTNETFPDYIKEKNQIKKIQKKIIEITKSTNITQEKKEKEIKELKETLKTLKNNLYEKLNLISSSYDEINPLVSFKEIQKECKLRLIFPEIIEKKYKYKNPSPIQSIVIPLLIKKKNIIASSETGSGKTFSYLIPIIHNSFLNKLKEKPNKIIIILPTKELAKQIFNDTLLFSKYYCEGSKDEIKVKYVNKGMIISIEKEYEKFLVNNDIFISTPKNILNLINICNDNLLNKLLYVILDEADKFFDNGFIELIDEILSKISDKKNITKAFFSATVLENIGEIITSHIFDSIKISIGKNNIPAKHIYQEFIYCTNEEGKLIGIRNLFHEKIEFPILIFVEGINKLKSIYENIKFETPKISYIHSKMSKKERENQIEKFREGETWILLCSDLLSRGIDFKNVKTVINYDCPYKPVNYIHRIGRTGRAGKQGRAITFIIDNDVGKLKYISKMINNMIENNLKKGYQDDVKCPKWLINLSKKKE